MALIKRIIGHIIIIGQVSSHVMDFTFIKSKNVYQYARCHHPIVERPSAGSIWRMKKNITRDISLFSTLCSQHIHYGFESWSCTSLCHHVISSGKDFIHIAQTVIDKPWVSMGVRDILSLAVVLDALSPTASAHATRNRKLGVFEK